MAFTVEYEDALADYKKQDYQSVVDQGDARTQYSLGLMYKHGDGVQQDYKKAVVLYQKASDKGFAAAQANLGVLYYHGQGVIQDYAKAKDYLSKACEGGAQVGCRNYAILKKKGF